MNNTDNNFSEKLQELRQQGDLPGLDALVSSLSPEALAQYKTEITDTYDDFFGEWLYHYDCGKVSDPEDLMDTLLEVVASAQAVDPEKPYFDERAICYRQLADMKTETSEKLAYLQKAIDEYTLAIALPSQVKHHASLASVLMDQLEITQTFTPAIFRQMLSLYKRALAEYSEDAHRAFLWHAFHILKFDFPDKLHWHFLFLDELETSLTEYASEDVKVSVYQAEEMLRILSYDEARMTAAHHQRLNEMVVQTLNAVENLYTEDASLLNRLGSAFDKIAKRLEGEEKISHFETAVRFFSTGHNIQPAAWTFPSYAANALEELAKIYHAQGDIEKVREQFETGHVLYTDVYEHEKDFSVNLKWGKFLFEYARLGYDFDAPELLAEAKLRGERALELGNNYYSQPFLLLAKIALAEGDKNKCLEILQACKTTFTTQYATYGLDEVREDKDFAPVWAELANL